jgi:hypothetical protein
MRFLGLINESLRTIRPAEGNIMKNLIRVAAATLLLTLTTVLAAADATGKWVAEMPGRDGNTMTQTYVLKVDGAVLTGTVAGRGGETPISNGKVDGDNISFEVTRSRGEQSFTMKYTGKIEGDTLKLTWSGPNGQSREATAKRAN